MIATEDFVNSLERDRKTLEALVKAKRFAGCGHQRCQLNNLLVVVVEQLQYIARDDDDRKQLADKLTLFASCALRGEALYLSEMTRN